MENKIRKKSINTVIYLLLAAMLVCVLFVSVYTVASKRPGAVTEETTSKPDVTTTAAVTTAASVNDDSEDIDVDVEPVPDDEPVDAVTEDTLPAAVTDDEELPVTVDVRYFVSPVAGMASKDFEIDIPVYSLTMNDYRAHTGIDIAASVGSEVVAASSGVVCRVWSDPMMGQSVTIDQGEDLYTT